MTVTGDRRERPEDRSVERFRPSVAVTLSFPPQADFRLEERGARKASILLTPREGNSQGPKFSRRRCPLPLVFDPRWGEGLSALLFEGF